MIGLGPADTHLQYIGDHYQGNLVEAYYCVVVVVDRNDLADYTDYTDYR